MSERDYRHGAQDQKKNDYNPPGGTGLERVMGTLIGSRNEEIEKDRKAYDEGWEDSKKGRD